MAMAFDMRRFTSAAIHERFTFSTNPTVLLSNVMNTKIAEILSAKLESGENAYLWLQSADRDCILWPTQDASENEDSADQIGRWELTLDEAEELIETGEVNEVE
jgi:hypothetical protein